MNINTEAEPRWLKNIEKLFEFVFKLSFIFVAILSSYIIWYLLFGLVLHSDFDDGSPQQEWCEEYHPDLTYNECSEVAGW